MTEPAAPPAARRLPSKRVLLAMAVGVALLCFALGWGLARLGGGGDAGSGPAATDRRTLARSLELESRVSRLESELRVVARTAAASLAVVSLGEAASGSTGFAQALAAAEAVLPSSPDLVALRPLATQGAPTEDGLVASFPSVAARARTAARPVDAGSALSGWSRALGRMFGEPAPRPARGVSTDAVLARAEAMLRGGDLAGAVDQLSLLPGPARDAFATWTAHARRRIEIDRRLDAVRTLTLRNLAAVTDPAEPAP